MRDVAAFARLVDDLIAIGGLEFSGIEAGLSNEKEMQDEVWEEAQANARERAEKTLKPAGIKIDSVFAISPVAFPQIYRNIFGSGFEGSLAVARELVPKSNPSQYRLAPVSVGQSIHVIYLISPAK